MVGEYERVKKPLRLALGGVAALVLAGGLVAPVVIGRGGSSRSCATTLFYSGHPYAVRPAGGAPMVQDLAIGVGITRGCGAKPENVDVRSLAGVRPARAVGLSGDPAVWVRRGVCARSRPAALLTCLSR
jgi:hypothetical protein